MTKTITLTLEQASALQDALLQARNLFVLYSLNCNVDGQQNRARALYQQGVDFFDLWELIYNLVDDATNGKEF